MLEGFVPTEVHEHFDADGVRTGTTVVHRESEWDEVSLARARRLVDYEKSMCPCGCGVPMEQAWDPTFEPWSVDTWTCYARRAMDQVVRRWEDENEHLPAGWSSGVHHYVMPADGAESHPEREHMSKAERAAESAQRKKSAPRMTRRNRGD